MLGFFFKCKAYLLVRYIGEMDPSVSVKLVNPASLQDSQAFIQRTDSGALSARDSTGLPCVKYDVYNQ